MHELIATTTLHFGTIAGLNLGSLNLTDLLRSMGVWALLVIAVLVFIENGLLFPFLPGDSLVFAAALLVVSLGIPLWLLIVVAAAAAIAGDVVGYALGARIGRRLFKPDARIFKTRYRDEADAFLQRYGAVALVLARFVPIVRTFVPPVVGFSTIPYRRFMLWNVVGGTAWAVVLCFAGFWLGRIPVVANNVDLIAVAIALISVIPIVIGFLRRRRGAIPTADSTEREQEQEVADVNR